MKNELTAFYRRYEEILHQNLSHYERDLKLSELMTDMERKFQISILNDPEWEKENRAIIALYRMISNSRMTLK